MAVILHGSEVVAEMNTWASQKVFSLKEKGISPTLAIVRVGERADDLSYERNAIKRCEKVGVSVKHFLLSSDVSQDELLQVIHSLNDDDSIHGILMFRPLPDHINEKICCEALLPAKDVDAATSTSLASVFTGSGQGFAPCTAQACMEILKHFNIDPCGKSVAVIGRSLVVGKPVSMLLMSANATVTTCHTKTSDVASVTRNADIIIAASGCMETIGKTYVNPGQIVIDVGIGWNEEKQKLCGDVIFDEVEPIVGAITPVPGGVGTVTTSVLVSHVIESAKRFCA